MNKLIYKENLIYNPFIITQIGDCQNEYILSPEKLFVDKDNFSKVLYAKVDRQNICDTFMRIFSYEGNIILVYFWATNITEELSQRNGLYVICGNIVNKDIFMENNYLVGYYFFQLIFLLAQNTHNDINSPNSDTCFQKLQTDSYSIVHNLYDTYCHLIMYNASHQTKRKLKISLYKNNKKEPYIIMPLSDSLYEKVQIFVNESLLVYKNNYTIFDFSTNKKITPYYFCFINNGCIISNNIRKVDVIFKNGIKYLKIFY